MNCKPALLVLSPFFVAFLLAQESPPPSNPPQEPSQNGNLPKEEDQAAKVRRVASEVDHLLGTRWEANGVVPSEPASDTEFMRRVYLDLVGKTPSVSDVREFAADQDPEKRSKLVNRLLESPSYIVHSTNIWRSIMIPEGTTDFNIRTQIPAFDSWLQKRFSENTDYSRVTRELLMTPIGPNASFAYSGGEPGPLAFYTSKGLKPENLAGSVSRVFLGVRIECAECHNHPMDRWTREEFWSFAAFFGGLETPRQGFFGTIVEIFDQKKLVIPGTEQFVGVGFLDGVKPTIKFKESARQVLADWITSPDNPYFAKTAVNRMWGQYFGTGIVDPVDDFTASNPPSHPEILELLTKEFIANNYDLKFLARVLTSTRAYQLSSKQTHPSQENVREFARSQVRGLSPEQIFDSLGQATGYYDPNPTNSPFNQQNGPREEFIQLFAAGTEGTVGRSTSVLQALSLMNGTFVGDATSLESSRTLVAIADFPLLTMEEKVEALFLASLSRFPTESEKEKFSYYAKSDGQPENQKKALSDIFWALLNSSEFLFNH